ncbi:MAG TPA: amidohydrolase [Verrucomicrobiales bacterium]|nr:amidohydrolase [Verrucomicrobiales bacterium]
MMNITRKYLWGVLLLVPGAPAGAESIREAIAEDYRKNLAGLFEHLHRHPELSFREFETAKLLARELGALGYAVTEGVGGTGVVAILENGDGPTVMLRADMDGLPLEEKTGLPYASEVKQVDITGIEQPVMHACGHDVHMTALVGAARQLAARRAAWNGSLVLVCQPAEERIGGARAMLEDGLYERFPKPDYALAFHVRAGMPAGTITVPLGAAFSSSDSVDITVHGIGAHGAAPHKGVDPVLVAAQIVVSLQSVVSRTLDPLKPGVITVGAIHGGTKHNIISDRVEMQLTVRSNDEHTRELLLDGIDRVAAGVARSLGVPDDHLPEVVRSPTETTPPTINDEATARRMREVFLAQFGDSVVIEQAREGMGAEDFAYFVTPESGVKGVYFIVGGTPPDEVASAPGHHSPLFRVEPEPSIRSGAEALVHGAMTLFGSP